MSDDVIEETPESDDQVLTDDEVRAKPDPEHGWKAGDIVRVRDLESSPMGNVLVIEILDDSGEVRTERHYADHLMLQKLKERLDVSQAAAWKYFSNYFGPYTEVPSGD